MGRVEDINFNWKYSPSFSEDYLLESFDDSFFQDVNIPHTNIELPFNNFDEKLYQFESCYRKRVHISLQANERVYITFGAVMLYAKLYCNGKYVGEHKGGYTPFTFDITDYVKNSAENLLTLSVDSHERPDIPPFGFVVDYLTYGGIYREVKLEYKSAVNIKRVLIKPKNVLSNPQINQDIYLRNGIESQQVTIRSTLIRDGVEIQKFPEHVRFYSEVITLNFPVEDIELWAIDNPVLYHLKTELIINGIVVDTSIDRFGFRDIQFKLDGFYLNGEKIKIVGLNRHQSFPYVGYAMPKSAQYRDAEILKRELGVNLVRLSHYPQSDHFMDRCDELGLLVFDELPGWQHIGNRDWQDIAVSSVKEMILKDVNHPSVIIWGVRINESQDDHDFYKRTNAVAKELDPTRATGGVRCIKNSELLEDVYTYNDFVHTGQNQGIDKKLHVSKSKAPHLVTEFNGHMFPTKKYDDEKHRTEHAKRHLNVLNDMMGEDNISGAIGWCMFDYNTHKDFGSGDKICYHGVMDMFRIPKHAAYVYASQGLNEPFMQVINSISIGEYESSLIEDIMVFTNCYSVKLYKNDHFIKEFRPARDIYPNLKNPPIIIDDFIGDLIEKNERYTPKDAERVKRVMTKISKEGYNLSLMEKLTMVYIFFKYKMNKKDGEDLYTKYFGGWGGSATDYRFEGIKDGEVVKIVNRSQVFNPSLKLEIDNNRLVEDRTWDTTRCVVSLLDDYGNNIYYANDAFVIETEGPIEVIGPKVTSLVGGSTGFWIKTTGEAGSAKVIIQSERFGKQEVELEVDKV